ncbi:MAG: hypothetical protein HC902_00855 [Calothrix sp. SM1_5_4]|nr:hypothetical protein [Calothrix sp. SM1_5_4]
MNLDPALFSEGSTELNPATDKIAADCARNSAFDACLYRKNPVAQKGAVVEASDLNGLRVFGVKIRGLSASGHLENKTISVVTAFTPRFSLLAKDALKSDYDPGSSRLEQVSAYYWATRTVDYLGARVGRERVPLSGLRIYPDDAFTGFTSEDGAIHLEKNATGVPKAFSGEVVAHLLGQALAHELSGRRALSRGGSGHRACLLNPRGCCASEVGCAQALTSPSATTWRR